MEHLTCNHPICANILKHRHKNNRRINGGVAVIIMNGNNEILVGKETEGSKKGQYNICTGKMDDGDGHCCIKTLRRELWEEYCIKVTEANFKEYFHTGKGNVRHFIIRGSCAPVFIGVFKDLDVVLIRNLLKKRFEDPTCLPCMKEISKVELITKNNMKIGDGELCSFANMAIRRLKVF